LARLFDRRAAGEDPRLRFVEHFETGGDAVLKSACKLSLEGIDSKQADAPYQSGRTATWAKSKCRAGHEVVIGVNRLRTFTPFDILDNYLETQ
jgi:bifunctional non-homologous end joining protein LigD